MSMMLLGAGSSGGGGGAPSYERTAFVSSTGDDGNAVLNTPSQPWQTLVAAYIVLTTEYPGQACAIALLSDLTENFTPSGSITLTLKGHESLRTITGDINAQGTDNAISTNQPGGDGISVNFDAIHLVGFYYGNGGGGGPGDGGVGASGGNGASFSAINSTVIDSCDLSGGAGGQGGGAEEVGYNGGNGGNGGFADLDGTSSITSFTSAGGPGGAGGGGNTNGSTGASGNSGGIV